MGMQNGGFSEIAGLVGATGTCTAFTYLANGSDSTAHDATRTTMRSENATNGLERAAATVSRTTTSVTNDTLRLTKTWTATGAVTIKEVAAFNASLGGDMLGRTVTPATRTLASGDSYALTYDFAFA